MAIRSDSLTLIEAARALRLSEWQVKQRVVKGELDGGQVMGRWWVSLASVDAFKAKDGAA